MERKRLRFGTQSPRWPPFKVYIYETKGQYIKYINGAHTKYGYGRAQVIGEFVCDKIITVDCDSIAPFDPETHEYIQAEICLDRAAFIQYTNFKKAFGWHISDLKIYDKSKELREFSRPCNNKYDNCWDCDRFAGNKTSGDMACDNKITRPPQSYMYVEELQE